MKCLYIWMKIGDWKRIMVSKVESKHNFPVAHTDMMEQCIDYKVKYDELCKFD
ncbi:MAG: hypothetical protein WKF59_25735 [Chitinophagaceae bacterium]